MHSSIILSATLLATGAISAPIAYSTAAGDQDISTRDTCAEASNYSITDKLSTHDRRQATNPIIHNGIQAAKVGKNKVQHQVEQQIKAPSQSTYRPPKFESTPQGQAMKASKPGSAPARKNPLEGWHKGTRDILPEGTEDSEGLERRQIHPVVYNGMQAAKVGKNRLQHQAKQQYNAPAQSGFRAPKFENTPQGQAIKAPKQKPAQGHSNPLQGWHKARDVAAEDAHVEGDLE